MATCSTSQWVSTSPYVKLTVTEQSSTALATTLTWTLHYIASSAANTNNLRSYTVKINGSTVKSGTYDIDGKTGTNSIATGGITIDKGTSAKSVAFSVSFAFNLTWSGTYAGTKSASGSISIPAKTSYAVKYNANGGSGAPSSQTKWYGADLTLSSTKPTKTGHTFKGWAASASATTATYAAGAKYTANAAITLYAVWEALTYTVSYNANGGVGAPASQTKTYGVALTLSPITPTRTNYIFKGWGMSANATTVSYAAGATYTVNAASTLYAVWESSYKKPTIGSMGVSRCNSSGTYSDTGTYAKVTAVWTSTVALTSAKIEWKASTATTWANSKTVNVSGQTSGTISVIIGDGNLNTDTTYSVRLTIADSTGSTMAVRNVPGSTFLIDFLHNGKGIAIGKPAEVENTFDVNYISRFRKDVGVGNKHSHQDGNTGVYLDAEGYIHLQRETALGYHPYIGFYLDAETDPACVVRLNSQDRFLEFLSAKGYKYGNNLYLANSCGIYGADTNGNYIKNFDPCNDSGNTTIGYGNYSNASGNTNIYGNDVVIGSAKAGNTSFRPYYRAGDSFEVVIRTSGYVSNSGKNLYFHVPLSLPIIGNPTATASSVSGFILRQGDQYTHGSAAETYAKPSSYSVAAYSGRGITINAAFSNATNVTNNDAIGIHWSGKITFS